MGRRSICRWSTLRGREETLSTIQLDFLLPERFELSFNRGANEERPVMVHRSIVSTMERMVAHLLEVHNGALPVWLAPTQVVIMPVTSSAVAYARQVQQAFLRAGLRAEVDDRDATLGARVRDAQQRRAPYMGSSGSKKGTRVASRSAFARQSRLPSMSVEAVRSARDRCRRQARGRSRTLNPEPALSRAGPV